MPEYVFSIKVDSMLVCRHSKLCNAYVHRHLVFLVTNNVTKCIHTEEIGLVHNR